MRGRPAAEQQAFAQAHPDLYERAVGPDGQAVTRLRIEDGRMTIASLACPGFGSAVLPDFRAMKALATPTSLPRPAPEP